MTYRITGLDPAAFAHFVKAGDATLANQNAVRVTAAAKPGYPCRITLEDAEPGETLILLNYVSHDVATPYRNAYAIFEGRPIALRAFDTAGMLRSAALALPGRVDETIHSVFADPEIAYIHAHNAAHGCFAAVIERT